MSATPSQAGSLAALTLGAGRSTEPPRWTAIFLLGVPLSFGLVFGWMGAGRTANWPMGTSLAFWCLLCLGSWTINDVTARFAAGLLRPWKPRLLLMLLAGSLLASALIFPLTRKVIALFHSHWVQADLQAPLPQFDVWSGLNSLLPGALIWIGVNLFVVQVLHVGRYGFAPPASATRPDPPRAPLFMSRLPASAGTRLLAIEAQQHYLRVITETGGSLVLYRMSDAVRELAGWPGLQVHRSWWVHRDAIIRVDRSDAGPLLVLDNGTKVPVSRSFRQAAQQAGLF